MKMKKQFILRTVAGDNILIPVGRAVTEYNGIFSVSPTAAVAFSSLAEGKNEDEILSDILESFDIDKETAKNDLDVFFEQLRSLDII